MATKIKPKKKKNNTLGREMDNIAKMTLPQAQSLLAEMAAVNKQLKFTTDAMMTALADQAHENSKRLATLEDILLGDAGAVVDPREAPEVRRCILSDGMRKRLGIQVEELKENNRKALARLQEQDVCTDVKTADETQT